MIIFVRVIVPPVTLIKIKKSILIFTLDDVEREQKKLSKATRVRKKVFQWKFIVASWNHDTIFYFAPACHTANVDTFIKCDCHRHLMKFILYINSILRKEVINRWILTTLLHFNIFFCFWIHSSFFFVLSSCLYDLLLWWWWKWCREFFLRRWKNSL